MSDENEAPPKQDDPMITILGGVEMEVTHLAEEHLSAAAVKRLEKFKTLFGTTERVKVRQVLVSQMAHYGNAILYNDEAAVIEIYCEKEPGWADTLTSESVNAVAEKGLDINLPFFSAWYRRQAKWKEIQTPQAIVDLQKKLAELETTIKESLSPSLSEPSPVATS